jgi:hypothetical protein
MNALSKIFTNERASKTIPDFISRSENYFGRLPPQLLRTTQATLLTGRNQPTETRTKWNPALFPGYEIIMNKMFAGLETK